MTPAGGPQGDPMSLGYVLDRLADCTDVIARLVMPNREQKDVVDALMTLDAAIRTLDAHERDHAWGPWRAEDDD